jgi:high frequency lysogenization protein
MLSAASLTSWEQQQVALATMVQSAVLVRDLAHEGEVPQDQLAACINPLLVLDPQSLDDVYSDLSSLSRGFQTIQDMFGSDRVRSLAEVIRYTNGIMLLRNKLLEDDEMQDTLRRRLQYLDPLPSRIDDLEEDGASSQRSHQERILQQLANLYQDTISTLTFRVQVQGKIDNLKDDLIANSIRALLLAGIRSAVLWYQLGGRRWRLVVHRKRIRATAAGIRRKLIAPVQQDSSGK